MTATKRTQTCLTTMLASGALLIAACGGTSSPTTAPATTAAATPDLASAPVGCDLETSITVDENIEFASGASGVRISNELEADSRHVYSLQAAAGQAITATVSGGASVGIYESQAPFAAFEGVGTASASPLSYTGEYTVEVFAADCKPVAYNLSIQVPVDGSTVTPTPAADGQAAGGQAGSTATGGEAASTDGGTDSTGGQIDPDTDDGANEAAACPAFTDFTTPTAQNWPMRICQQGPLVREVQQALKDQGFNVTVDGLFGEQTAAAVKQWRGDDIAELIPSDVEALLPQNEPDPDPATDPGADPSGGALSPPSVNNSFIDLVDGANFTSTVDLVAGDRLSVQVLDGGGTDPFLEVIAPNGDIVGSDDDSGEGDLDSLVVITAQSAGIYTIQATTINGVNGPAQLQVIVN